MNLVIFFYFFFFTLFYFFLCLNCDLVTGEDRRFAKNNLEPSEHLSTTVEMLSLEMKKEIAIIDEIQMLRDEQRGYAFTRALLGVMADEVYNLFFVKLIDLIYCL